MIHHSAPNATAGERRAPSAIPAATLWGRGKQRADPGSFLLAPHPHSALSTRSSALGTPWEYLSVVPACGAWAASWRRPLRHGGRTSMNRSPGARLRQVFEEAVADGTISREQAEALRARIGTALPPALRNRWRGLGPLRAELVRSVAER